MSASDFLNVNVTALCQDLAGEINKVYQNLPWALKHEAVSRLKRQVHQLSLNVTEAKGSLNRAKTEKLLREGEGLAHECVPLFDLCRRKNLLSEELQERWTKRLNEIVKHLEIWRQGVAGKQSEDP